MALSSGYKNISKASKLLLTRNQTQAYLKFLPKEEFSTP